LLLTSLLSAVHVRRRRF